MSTKQKSSCQKRTSTRQKKISTWQKSMSTWEKRMSTRQKRISTRQKECPLDKTECLPNKNPPAKKEHPPDKKISTWQKSMSTWEKRMSTRQKRISTRQKECPPDNLRPITLMNSLRKALSIVTLQRIGPHIEDFLSKNESGFWHQRSATDAIWTQRLVAAKTLKEETTIKISGIDMSAAFHAINRIHFLDIAKAILSMKMITTQMDRYRAVFLAGFTSPRCHWWLPIRRLTEQVYTLVYL